MTKVFVVSEQVVILLSWCLLLFLVYKERLSMSETKIKAKIDQVKNASEMIQRYGFFLIFEYPSLTANEISLIRRKLYDAKALMHVFKNNVLLRAFNALNISDYDSFLVGPNAIAFGNDTTVMKIVGEALKDKEIAKVKVGRLNGVFVDQPTIQRVISLGSKNDLIAQLLSVFQAPIRRFLAVLTVTRTAKNG